MAKKVTLDTVGLPVLIHSGVIDGGANALPGSSDVGLFLEMGPT